MPASASCSARASEMWPTEAQRLRFVCSATSRAPARIFSKSRYAEADTPMHAMMDAEQILEHAKAAEAAGAHRFCMVTQGQGLSKRDFEKIVDGARMVAEQTNL